MTNPNDPAFPALYGQTNGADGLTKREYFAAMAMQGLLAKNGFPVFEADLSTKAVRIADSVMAFLDVPKGDL